MSYVNEFCKIVEKQQLSTTIFSFVVQAPQASAQAKPGQFANIYVPGKTLRRPISICDCDKAAGTLRFVFEIRGEGTEILSQMKEGDTLEMLAPLGNGYEIGDTSRKALFVGGGIGVPPLLLASKAYGSNADVLLGFRSEANAVLMQDFEANGASVAVATEDGSLGEKGFVTVLLEEKLKSGEYDMVYTCGAPLMMQKVALLAKQYGVPCQVSLEERMGCGIGACLVCACKVKSKTGYVHVCKDGPVFDSEEVEWDG